MAGQELDRTPQAEEKRLELLWDAYKAQEDELMALQGELETTTNSRDQFKAKLAKEEERLQKLWDAYRVQEDELKDLKERLPLMEEKLIERQRTIESLERDIALLEPLTQKGKNASDLQRENERLKADLEVLKAQKGGSGGVDPKELKKAQDDLEKERERLEKLYVLYQEQEADIEHLERTVQEWEDWGKKMRSAVKA